MVIKAHRILAWCAAAHYLVKVTGLSHAQVTRCIARFLVQEHIADQRRAPAAPFVRRYRVEDIRLLAAISNGHLHNLRHHQTYRAVRGSYDKTRPVRVNIGEHRKPFPDGRPGYLRVDSVHQGDLDGIKGVYLINAVDEVTQFQVICAVEKISEAFLRRCWRP